MSNTDAPMTIGRLCENCYFTGCIDDVSQIQFYKQYFSIIYNQYAQFKYIHEYAPNTHTPTIGHDCLAPDYRITTGGIITKQSVIRTSVNELDHISGEGMGEGRECCSHNCQMGPQQFPLSTSY